MSKYKNQPSGGQKLYIHYHSGYNTAKFWVLAVLFTALRPAPHRTRVHTYLEKLHRDDLLRRQR
jgi:hypothetical protein